MGAEHYTAILRREQEYLPDAQFMRGLATQYTASAARLDSQNRQPDLYRLGAGSTGIPVRALYDPNMRAANTDSIDNRMPANVIPLFRASNSATILPRNLAATSPAVERTVPGLCDAGYGCR